MLNRSMYAVRLVTIVSILFIVQSCELSNREIEDKYWWFSEIRRGNPKIPLRHQIDHIVFAESKYYVLVDDTIYRDDLPYALIINRERKPQKMIEIVILGSADTIRYVAK